MTTQLPPAVAAVAAEWNDLCERVGASPFMRPVWIGEWWNAFGSGRLEERTVRSDGRLRALVPVVPGVRSLRSPTNWHTPEFAPLAEDEDAAAELARTLFDDVWTLDFALLYEWSGALRAAATAAGHTILERVMLQSPYVEPRGTFDEYLASLTKDRRGDLRRHRRRLEAMGELTTEIADGRERFDEYLAEAFRIEGSGWKTERGTAIVSQPHTLRLYTEVARWAAAAGMLRLCFLRLDGKPIATEIALETNRRIYLVKGGYDVEYRKYGPGMLLEVELVGHVHRNELESLELLGKAEPWKLELTKLVRERVRLQSFAPSIPGRSVWAAYRFGRPHAKRAMAAVARVRRR
jgi:CelD/BcsL family acetyltransferase involved in cellulose biosynthesis